MNMQYEAVIGLEIHAQLLTESKIFCGCSTRFGEPPNSQTCPVCLGLPGTLPVLNKKAVDFAIMMGLAAGSEIVTRSRFARKNYFYPDLPKGYQITQYEQPLCRGGGLEIPLPEGGRKRIGLTRIHLEEDAGKSIHGAEAGDDSVVDLNRCGVPLIEIVTEPDIRSAAEAHVFLKHLKQLLLYLKICDGNMEEGSLRCDANVSVRPRNSRRMTVKTELKNMNSFRNVERALEFEIHRQQQLLTAGEKVRPETLLWDAGEGEARPMRRKEAAHDYRYFPEPDLPPLNIDRKWVNKAAGLLPELPENRRRRFAGQFGLPPELAALLTNTRALADFYEAVVSAGGKPELSAHLVSGEVLRILNEKSIGMENFPVSPQRFAALVQFIDEGIISRSAAKTVLDEMLDSRESPAAVIRRLGLRQLNDAEQLKEIIAEVVSQNDSQVRQYLQGKKKVLSYFIGQVMKRTGGTANPRLTGMLIEQELKSLGKEN